MPLTIKKGLLFGAGFSYDLGMPLVTELTSTFLELFDERSLIWLESQMLSQNPYTSERPINKQAIKIGLHLLHEAVRNHENNYEHIIAKYEKMEKIDSPSQSDRDSYHYIHGVLYGIVHLLLCLYQEASYEIAYPISKKWFCEFGELLSEEETWVFNLNHDLYVECLALDLGLPITYGDTNSFKFPLSNLEMTKQLEFGVSKAAIPYNGNNNFFHKSRGINLVKLHGGLSEFYYKDKEFQCNLMLNKPSSKILMDDFIFTRQMGYYDNRGRVPTGGSHRVITNMDGELDIIVNSLLTGENKFSRTSDTKKGEEKLQKFDDILKSLDELTIIGYGFGDKHINFRISNALLLNPSLRVRIVDPYRYSPPECLEQFDYNERVNRALCGAAPWMHYCKHQGWDTTQVDALKNIDRKAIKENVIKKLQAVNS